MSTMTTDHPSAPPAADGPPTIRVADGLVGFPDTHTYHLVGGDGGVFELVPLELQGPGFVAAAAALFYPDYRPVLDDAAVERLQLADADEALVLVIVTVGSDVNAAYGNLLAPVVVNTRTGAAAQVVLSGQDFPLRAPLAVAGSGS